MLTTTFRNGCRALFFLLLLQVHSQAQTQPKALADLARLEGHWEAKASFVSEGKTYTFTYHADFKKSEDGAGLYMKEWFNSPELGKFVGTNLVGYNANDSKIHWFSMDNFGTTHDHIGLWKSPGHFSMQANEIVKKKKFVENIDLRFNADGSMNLLLVSMLDGKESYHVSGVFQQVQNCNGE